MTHASTTLLQEFLAVCVQGTGKLTVYSSFSLKLGSLQIMDKGLIAFLDDPLVTWKSNLLTEVSATPSTQSNN
jgi:hypothetical protein